MPITGEDRLRMQDVIIGIYAALDGHDGETYATFFTEDGVLSNKFFGRISGRSDIAKFVNKHCADGHENGALHLLSNFLFREDEPDPTVKVELIKWRVNVSPPEPWVSAFVQAKFRLVNGRWLVSNFNLVIRTDVYQNYDKWGNEK